MSDGYDLLPLQAPRTAGVVLRLSVALLERNFPGNLLARKLLRDVGLEKFRAAPCDEALPTIHPLFGSDGVANESHGEGVPIVPGFLEAPSGFPQETSADFRRAYEEGRTTPTAVASQIVQRVQELESAQPPLASVIDQEVDDLLAQAKTSTERYQEGRTLGPLDGVPIGIKDELDVAGYRTRVGTRFMGQEPSPTDASTVGRLRAAGALLIGKLNMHEIGIGVTGINPHYGAARNPHDPSRSTGGSSSGSASAVAAGICPVSVGADGGGSIRIPAALCGVVGLKPTFGRVSEHGAAPLCWSVAHVGPLGASVHDVALAYAHMAGFDPADPNTRWQTPVGLDGKPAGPESKIRLGIFRSWFEDADDGVVKACYETIEKLSDLGVSVVEIDLPELGLLRTAHMVTISTEMLCSQRPHFGEHLQDYGHDTRLNLALARRITADDYIRAQRLRVRMLAHFARALDGVDAIVTPTTGMTAPKIANDALRNGESNLAALDRIMRFAPAANLTGLPALSVPAGYDEQGLPVGLQLMGAPWSEARLLQIGRLVEAVVERRNAGLYATILSP